MQITIDWEVGVLYVVFGENAEPDLAERIADEVVLDLDEDKRVIGFEVQGSPPSAGIPRSSPASKCAIQGLLPGRQEVRRTTPTISAESG